MTLFRSPWALVLLACAFVLMSTFGWWGLLVWAVAMGAGFFVARWIYGTD